MKKYIYPAVFTKEKQGGYSVSFPDLPGCFTEGDSLKQANDMAQDALGLYLYTLKQDNQKLPDSTDPTDIKLKARTFISLVEWDELEYLKKVSNKSVKKTLTIPSWLNKAAEEKKINFSKILQDSLLEKLNIAK